MLILTHAIVYKHWPETREFITRTVEIGGLDCHVITTEYW